MAAMLMSVLGLSSRAMAAELIMFEQEACEWCEIWDEKIAPIYPETAEGTRAPLRRIDIHAPIPTDVAHIPPGPYTPTFVLIKNGVEVGRIRGYPGEDFFWGMLDELIRQLPDDLANHTITQN